MPGAVDGDGVEVQGVLMVQEDVGEELGEPFLELLLRCGAGLDVDQGVSEGEIAASESASELGSYDDRATQCCQSVSSFAQVGIPGVAQCLCESFGGGVVVVVGDP